MTRRGLALGIIATSLYLTVAFLSFQDGRLVVRPVFDGLGPPPPYQWLKPPPELAADNVPAEGGSGTVLIGPSGSEPTSITTRDVQASVIFAAGAVPAKPDQWAASVEITPRDPMALDPPPPKLRFDGQAYDVQATYMPSGEPVVLDGSRQVQVVLRYPIHATRALHWTGSNWADLPATLVPESLQLVANIRELGAFVAAAPPSPRAALPEATPWWAYGAAGGGLVLLSLGTLLRIRRVREHDVRRDKR